MKTNTFTNRIVILSGPKGSGKTHMGELLCTKHSFVRHSLASPLKEILSIAYGESEHFLRPSLKEKKHPNSQHTNRHLMQQVGTEFFRRLDEDVWSNALVRRLKAEQVEKCSTSIVIDDCRFDNEYTIIRKFAKDYNYQFDSVRLEPLNFKGYDKHPSEKGISDVYIDKVIINAKNTKAENLFLNYLGLK